MDTLNSILHAYNVRRSKLYGGQLTGDAAMRFFNITTPIKDQPYIEDLRPHGEDGRQWLQRWLTILMFMTTISHLIMRPTPLCDHEVATVESLCIAIASYWHDHFIERVFPKLHVLCIDLPRFVKEHRTVCVCLYVCMCYVCVCMCVWMSMCVYVCVCVPGVHVLTYL